METNSINSFLVLITGDIDNFMYTYILVALLVFTGIYFTIRTKGVQFRYIKDMFTQLFEKKVDKNGKAISSFQAMMVSTGSRVGTGNIAGIATALAMGGPGALFWMWAMALIGGASAFCSGSWSSLGCAEAVQFVPPNAMQQAIRSEQPITRMGVRCRWLCLSFALLERAADISSSFQRHQA